MICFIIGADGTDSRGSDLARLAEQLGYRVARIPSLEALRAEPAFVEAKRPLVLVPDFAASDPETGVLGFAREQAGHAFVVYVADAIAPDLYKQLIRTQSGEWIAWKTGPQELRDLVKSMIGGEAADRPAKVVSFLPSKGGVGNSMLALETGVHLSTRGRRSASRLAILDLNLQGGTLADALDIEPRFDVSEIIERPERLDEQLVDIFTSRYSGRLDVFASPSRQIKLEDVPPQILFTFLDTIAKRYDAILIDLPDQWISWVDNILLGSDLVVVSGGSTVPGLRKLTGRLGDLDRLGIPSVRLAAVVNPCEADLFGRIGRRAEIDRALATRTVFCVRRDVASAASALDAGRPLLEVAPNARVSRDVRRLAEWVGTTGSQT